MALAVVGAIFAIAKYIETTKKNRLPAGVKKLPGPKGTINGRTFLVSRVLLTSAKAYLSLVAYMKCPRRTVG